MVLGRERSRVSVSPIEEMEIGDDGDEKKTPPPPGDGGGSGGGGTGAGASGSDRPPKRMMKSPYQLEVLEKTYASSSIPSLFLPLPQFFLFDRGVEERILQFSLQRWREI